MDIYQADTQLAAARHLRWMPDRIALADGEITVDGWALTVWDAQERQRFLVNGGDFDKVEWPLASPDLLGPFSAIPNAAASRFRLRHRVAYGRDVFPDGFARFNVTSQFGEHRLSYRTAWYLADPAHEPAMPSTTQIARVIGSGDEHAFRFGGATIVKRFEQLLLERFGRPLASFERILDWGCGAGRLTRYLTLLSPAVTGIDIDSDNIAHCAAALPSAHFLKADLMPPTALPDASFDLVMGVSVLTHLDEPVQNAWLEELRRITRPDALLLLSVEGLAQMALYGRPAELRRETHTRGIVDGGANTQLRDVIDDTAYYRNVMHSPDYIMAAWSAWFEVLDIVQGMAGNQDLVLLRRRRD